MFAVRNNLEHFVEHKRSKQWKKANEKKKAEKKKKHKKMYRRLVVNESERRRTHKVTATTAPQNETGTGAVSSSMLAVGCWLLAGRECG